MNFRKIIIIYNSRIPTEKANGYQTFKTAESLIMQNKEVEIWAPKRFNLKDLKKRDLKDYYNLSKIPRVVKINVIDFLSLIKFENFLSVYLKLISNIILTATFSCGVLLRILFRNDKEAVYFTRDVNLSSFLINLIPSIRRKLFIELHNLPLIKNRKNRQVRILEKCAGIICLTDVMQNELIKNDINKSNIIHEPDAVDINQFKINITKKEARGILKLPINKKIFLYIGKFHTLGNEKGIPEIIKSVKYLDLNEEYKIYIVGGPLDRVKKYKQIIRNYKIDDDKFVFLGRQEVKTIPIWLKAADILLMPHPKTIFYQKYVSPLKLFEYMCSNNPIIASDLDSIREILIHENNSYLVHPGSSKSIARAIKLLLKDENLSTKIAKKAFIDVDNFSWIKRGERIIKFISERINFNYLI